MVEGGGGAGLVDRLIVRSCQGLSIGRLNKYLFGVSGGLLQFWSSAL